MCYTIMLSHLRSGDFVSRSCVLTFFFTYIHALILNTFLSDKKNACMHSDIAFAEGEIVQHLLICL